MAQTFWLFGTYLRILSDEQQTNSTYDLIEGQFPANIETPLHLHSKYSELIYVLDGEFTVYTHKGKLPSPRANIFLSSPVCLMWWPLPVN
jgi:hypothetical protein